MTPAGAVTGFGTGRARPDGSVRSGRVHQPIWPVWRSARPEHGRRHRTDGPWLDDGLGTSYYITLGPGTESGLFGNATDDIGHDSYPMIFLVDAGICRVERSHPTD